MLSPFPLAELPFIHEGLASGSLAKVNTMSTTIETSVKSPAVKPAAVSDKDAAQAKQNAIKAAATVEAQAFGARVKALIAEAEAIGNLALNELASGLGESANKLGKPGESAYLSFLIAMSHRKADYNRRAELAKIANASVPFGHKPVAIVKAKASSAQGQASYRFNAPAVVEIALGD